MEDSKEALAKTYNISERIFGHLTPLIRTDESALCKKIASDLDDLCLKAMHLALRMRESHSIHEIVDIKKGRQILSSEEHDLQIADSLSVGLNENTLTQSKVAFQVSGALVSQEFGVGKHIVLEKARVVVRL